MSGRTSNHSPTRLLLIRHAHVDTEGRICGWLDLPLSPAGRRQLAVLAEDRPIERPVAVYTSTLRRAQETANALGAAWELTPHGDPALREINCGSFEGLEIARVQREHPTVWAQNLAQDDPAFAWPGGETYREFRARILQGLAQIAQRHSNQPIAIVTHTGVITQVVGALQGRSAAAWDHHRAAPFSATAVQWYGDGPQRLDSFSVRDWWRAARQPA